MFHLFDRSYTTYFFNVGYLFEFSISGQNRVCVVVVLRFCYILQQKLKLVSIDS